ncbi:hypothetical protein AAMO2058_000910700 [Amorphochlora amoebiformis]
MFKAVARAFGTVCGGKRSKTLEGEKPKSEKVSEDEGDQPRASMYKDNKKKMFDMLYGDMKEDLNQLEQAGLPGTTRYTLPSATENDSDGAAVASDDENGGLGAGTGILEDEMEDRPPQTRLMGNFNEEDIQMAWEEAINPETGDSFFHNTITGEVKGPGAPSETGQRRPYKKAGQPPPSSLRHGTTLSAVPEARQSRPVTPEFVSPRRLPRRDLYAEAGGEEEEDYDLPTSTLKAPAQGKKENKEREEEEKMEEKLDKPDFFSAFANGATGSASPSTLSRLTTKKRMETVSKQAEDQQQKTALESIFSANPNAPSVEPEWHRSPKLPILPRPFEVEKGPVNKPRGILEANTTADTKIQSTVPVVASMTTQPPATPLPAESKTTTQIGSRVNTYAGSAPISPQEKERAERKDDLFPPPGSPPRSVLTGMREKAGSVVGVEVDARSQGESTYADTAMQGDLLAPGEEPESDLVQAIIKGVSTAAKFYMKKRRKEERGMLVIEEKDPSAILKLSFKRSKTRPIAFKFKAYAEPVFENLRRITGMNHQTFVRSLAGSNASADFIKKKRGWYYFTHDSCLIVKTQTRPQNKKSRDMIEDYYDYVRKNPGTLLEPVLGSYRLDYKGKIYYLNICKNLFYTTLPLHTRYKLKGVRSGRKASKKEREMYQGLLKDDDFKDRCLFLGAKKEGLLKQLESDTRFLSQHKLISYHILVGIHESKYTMAMGDEDQRNLELMLAQEEDEIFKQLELSQIKSIHPDGKEAQEVYFIGITGLSRSYTSGSRARQMIKGIFKNKEDMEVVDHRFYQE